MNGHNTYGSEVSNARYLDARYQRRYKRQWEKVKYCQWQLALIIATGIRNEKNIIRQGKGNLRKVEGPWGREKKSQRDRNKNHAIIVNPEQGSKYLQISQNLSTCININYPTAVQSVLNSSQQFSVRGDRQHHLLDGSVAARRLSLCQWDERRVEIEQNLVYHIRIGSL